MTTIERIVARERAALPPAPTKATIEIAISRAAGLATAATVPHVGELVTLIGVMPDVFVGTGNDCVDPSEQLPRAYHCVPPELSSLAESISADIAANTPSLLPADLLHGLAGGCMRILAERGSTMSIRSVWKIIGISINDPENAVAIPLPGGVTAESLGRCTPIQLGVVSGVVAQVYQQTTEFLESSKER